MVLPVAVSPAGGGFADAEAAGQWVGGGCSGEVLVGRVARAPEGVVHGFDESGGEG